MNETAALTRLAPTAGAPPESAGDPAQLALAVDGVAFPYWEGRLGWHSAGARTDHIGGRTVTTVFYANSAGQRIGYAIVAGTPAAQDQRRRRAVERDHLIPPAHRAGQPHGRLAERRTSLRPGGARGERRHAAAPGRLGRSRERRLSRSPAPEESRAGGVINGMQPAASHDVHPPTKEYR